MLLSRQRRMMRHNSYMKSLYPAPLKKGDTIGVIAPSSVYDVMQLTQALDYLEAQGFNVIFHPQTVTQENQFAGTPAQKVSALHDYFKNPDINAIFCTSGGNGAIHFLDQIDFNLIKDNPKIFIGFSDITLLLNAISSQTGLVTFHGPTLSRMQKIDSVWLDQMMGTLTGRIESLEIEAEDMEGTLYGGNLSVMQALIGTPYAPDMAGAILLLEDINDHLSRYDRMVAHMKQAGWMVRLNGVIGGEFLNSLDNSMRPFGFTIEEIIGFNTANTPKGFNAPFGHGENLCTLPIGANITLKNNLLSFKSVA